MNTEILEKIKLEALKGYGFYESRAQVRSEMKLTREHFDKGNQVIPLELALSILCNFNWVTK